MSDHMRPFKTIKMSDMIQAHIMDQVKCSYPLNKSSTTKLNSIHYSVVACCAEKTQTLVEHSPSSSYVSEVFPQIIQNVSVIPCLEYNIKREMDHLSGKRYDQISDMINKYERYGKYSEILHGT